MRIPIVIVRHGKAEPDSHSGLDADRELAERGLRHAAHLASRAHRWGDVGVIVSSDAVRARDTAQPIAQALGVALQHDERLRVDRAVGPVVDLLTEHFENGSGGGIVLVGHNPQLALLAGVLTLGGSAPGIEMKTGMAVVLRGPREMDGDGGLVGACELVKVERGEA